ncbi:MAG TPA: riboflavin biosynthesis protein RibF [Thermomicrobiales bacterium]|nr:riboflavin biosynthesis protein RibF [Thermomicrobiales bacterium]
MSIGTFDGVHRGHQFLLASAGARARDLALPLLAVTFEPYPAQVIRPESFSGRLNTAEEKLRRLWQTGVDDVVVVPFTQELKMESPETFLEHLVAATHPREVWVGEAFALGRNRSGDVARLSEIGKDLGFTLVAVPRQELHDQIVSSSRIRQYVVKGEVDRAETLLGYPYRIAGEVIRGAQIGRTIGFPTANVEPPAELVTVPDGIYATLATIDDEYQPHWAMTYIGTRPALNTGARQIETNILDFSGDLYGRTIHTDFIARLRPDSDFSSVEGLVKQLRLDEIATRKVLAAR